MQWGDTDAQNGYPCCVLQGQVALTCRFQAQLCYACFNAVELKTCKLGHLPQQPRREPYFLSSHMLYLTSQSTKLSDFLCFGFEVLIIYKDHYKKNGAKRLSSWRDMQNNVSFPLESTHLGYRCTTCAFNPVILYAGRLSKSEHMLG